MPKTAKTEVEILQKCPEGSDNDRYMNKNIRYWCGDANHQANQQIQIYRIDILRDRRTNMERRIKMRIARKKTHIARSVALLDYSDLSMNAYLREDYIIFDEKNRAPK